MVVALEGFFCSLCYFYSLVLLLLEKNIFMISLLASNVYTFIFENCLLFMERYLIENYVYSDTVSKARILSRVGSVSES